MYLSKLLHVFVKVVTSICQSCYIYLSKLLHVTVKVSEYQQYQEATAEDEGEFDEEEEEEA